MPTLTRSTSILINTNLQTAFNYISDLSKHPEWSGGELKIEAVSSDPIQLGKEYQSRGEVGKIQKERPNKLRVTEFESPHKFGFVAKDADFGDVFHTFTFAQKENSPEGTLQVLVTRTMTLTLNPFVAFAFNFITYPLLGRPADRKAMFRLKRKLES